MALVPPASRLPSQWTVFPGGQLRETPTDDAQVSLDVRAAADATSDLLELRVGSTLFVFADPAGTVGIRGIAGSDVTQLQVRPAAAQTNPPFKVVDANLGTLFSVPASGGVVSVPPASEAATLALGTAYQHSTARDVLLLVCLNVTVNTSGVLKLGVGPTNTPTQQNIVSGVTTTGQWFVPIYLPASYFALLSVTGTITVSIDGQLAMPV